MIERRVEVCFRFVQVLIELGLDFAELAKERRVFSPEPQLKTDARQGFDELFALLA
jgi:hypothetical protein